MWFGVVTLFPEMFAALKMGITGRALKEGLLKIDYCNPRDFTTDKHQSVDDRPYGGGPGMVMMAEPLRSAIHAVKASAPEKPVVIYLSPQGRQLTQGGLSEIVAKKSVILLAGRYEGVDERLIEQEVDEEWSIGDYILTGGELAAMVMIDAATRLLPGALGCEDSMTHDSLTTGLLKYPQYTRPETVAGALVPPVLLSGNHSQIHTWRLQASLAKTWIRRPDLLAKKVLTEEEKVLLSEFIEKSWNNA